MYKYYVASETTKELLQISFLVEINCCNNVSEAIFTIELSSNYKFAWFCLGNKFLSVSIIACRMCLIFQPYTLKIKVYIYTKK